MFLRTPPGEKGASYESAFDQANFACAGAFGGIFGCELHTLTFAEQLEHGPAHGTSVEEVLDAALVADEPEALVDQKARDCPAWHTRVLRYAVPAGIIPEALQAECREEGPGGRGPDQGSADDRPNLPAPSRAMPHWPRTLSLEPGRV